MRGRDYDALKDFAKKNLKPMCSPGNIDLCNADQKQKIEELQALSSEDLKAKIAAKDKEIEDAEQTFKDEVDKLQSTYKELQQNKDDALEAVKSSGLGLMKAVLAHSGNDKDEL